MTVMARAAAGVVAAYVIQQAAHQPFHRGPAGLAALLSGLPDPDLLRGWWRRRQAGGEGHNPHHALWTHTPLFSGIWSLLRARTFHVPVALVLGLALKHLLPNSAGNDDGIRWLWPQRRRPHPLWPRDLHAAGARRLAFHQRDYRQRLFLVLEFSLLLLAMAIVAHVQGSIP
ncbi:MAG: hypothetical protein J7452_10550 [Thermoflexus sp.]|jgi:hypothetical protein|nr:hypothetical protein [Thermoflexus sp.]